MYVPDPLKTMQDMLQLFHVRLHLFQAPYQDLPKLDFGLREHLFRDYDYQSMIQALRAPLHVGMAYSCVDTFGSHYVAFLLDTGGEPPPWEFAVMGPYRYQQMSEEDVDQLMVKHGIPQRLRPDLIYGLSRVPIIQQRELWVNLQVFLISGLICKDKPLEFRTPSDIPEEIPDFQNTVYREEQRKNYQEESLSGGYRQEEALLNAVKKGNIDQATRLAIKYVNFQINYHKQFGLKPQYVSIALNALLRRAAMEVGVHILRLDETFVKYNRLVDQQGHQPIQATYTDMVTDYCKLVAKYSRQNYSAAVRESLDYIDFNYQQDISLHKLAAMLNVSGGHLSTSFKKEVGISVIDYLNQTRVSHAKWLLESTTMPIQEISGGCGFSDASYFTRIFKRYTGQSPSLYRTTRELI